MNEKGGEYRHVLTVAELATHSHGTATGAAGGHDHGGSTGFNTVTGAVTLVAAGGVGVFGVAGSPGGNHAHSIAAVANHQHSIANDGSSQAHQNMPPYTVVPGYLICT